MQWLTASERRGATVLVLILLLGAGRDWWVARSSGRAVANDVAKGYAPGLESLAREAPSPAPPSGKGQPAGLVDLNRASASELEGLPGIGPVLARRIIAHRRAQQGFRRVEDLMGVRGIGPRLFARLRLLIVVPASASTPDPGTSPAGLHSAPNAPRGLADSASARAHVSR